MHTAVKEFLNYLNSSSADKKDLFDEPKKVSLQVSLHKIPNLLGDKIIQWYKTHTQSIKNSRLLFKI